jgi:hypothetical protein
MVIWATETHFRVTLPSETRTGREIITFMGRVCKQKREGYKISLREKRIRYENSDIDLIIVGEEFKGKSPLKRPVVLYLKWTRDYPVDFLCCTPEEFDERRKEISIVRQAIKEGVVI